MFKFRRWSNFVVRKFLWANTNITSQKKSHSESYWQLVSIKKNFVKNMSFQSKSEFHFCVVPIWQEDNLNRNQRLKAFQKFEGNEHCTAALSLRWFGLCRHKIFLRNLRKNSSRQKYFEAMQKWNFDFEFKPFFKVLSCSRIWCFISCHSYLIKCILLPINILQSYFNQIINSKQLLKQRGYKTPTSEPPPNYLVIFHSWMQFVRLCDIKFKLDIIQARLHVG